MWNASKFPVQCCVLLGKLYPCLYVLQGSCWLGFLCVEAPSHRWESSRICNPILSESFLQSTRSAVAAWLSLQHCNGQGRGWLVFLPTTWDWVKSCDHCHSTNEKTWREEEKVVSPLETDGYTACCGDVIPMVQSPLQSWWDKDCDTRMKPAREPERFLGYFLEKQWLNLSSVHCKMGLNIWSDQEQQVEGLLN